jgi:dsRNA-specific ribonuclease
VEEKIDFTDIIMNDINYKDQLAKYFNRVLNIPTKYKEISVVEEPIGKMYTMGVLDANYEVLTIGTGHSKKKAEQMAAHNALIHYSVL